MSTKIVVCPNGHSLQMDAQLAGCEVACPTCQATFHVPADSDQPATATPVTAAPAPSATPSIATAPWSWQDRIKPGMLGLRTCGLVLLGGGLLLVIMARGCDSLAARNVASLQASEQLSKDNFNDRWETDRLRIMDMYEDNASERSSALSKLSRDQQDEREKLERGEWRQLRIAARNARANTMLSRYWHEWLFLIGSWFLSAGLLGVGFTGEGADRWICLSMLVIITFSIYVGGFAWVGSLSVPLSR